MKYLLIILTMVLSGCATTVPKVEIQKVEIPVLKSCYGDKKVPSKPILLTDSLEEKTPLDVWLNGALKDVNELKVYSETLRTFICE